MVFPNKNIHHKMLASHFKHFDSFQIFRLADSKIRKSIITVKVFRKPIIVKSGIRRRSLAKAKRKINSLIISVTSNSWAVAGIQAPILDYETETPMKILDWLDTSYFVSREILTKLSLSLALVETRIYTCNAPRNFIVRFSAWLAAFNSN